MSRLRTGLLAGAAGTTVLNAATYLDMAVRGRPASEMPQRTVQAGLDVLGVELPGRRDEREARAGALGALAGIATGVLTGVAVAASRSAGLRLSAVLGSAVTTGVAMAATDGPAAALGVTDLRSWTAADWASDVLPHLVYGGVTHEVVRRAEERDPTTPPPVRPSAGLVVRAALLGVATGMRSSLGVAGAALVARGGRRTSATRVGSLLAVGAELVADKSPQTPSRLTPAGLVPRFGSAAVGATALAASEGAVADLPVLAGAAGAALGAYVGLAWRETATLDPLPAALVEDGVALALTAAVVRVRRGTAR